MRIGAAVMSRAVAIIPHAPALPGAHPARVVRADAAAGEGERFIGRLLDMVMHLTKFRAAAIAMLGLWLLVGVVGSVRVAAQAARATILGTVKDSSGAAVPGATVEVKHVATGVTQTAVSNQQGRYTVPDLQLGEYEVQASLTGFQTVLQKGIGLAVGSQSVVDFTLPIGQLAETITVESAVAIVNTQSSAVGAVVEQRQISDLPLNGRNFSQLITLAPGANSLPFGGTGGNAFFGRQANFSISGSRPEGQAFLLDNTNIQGYWNRGGGSGILGTTLGVEAVSEFQALTGTYSAQFGGNGSVINAITKAGSNAVHGSAYEYVRNSRFDAANYFDTAGKPDFSKHQFGGSVGGPLKQNKAFYFFNYEGLRQELGETRVITVPDQNARNGLVPVNGVLTNVGVNPAVRPILDLYPLPTTPLAGGVGQATQVASAPGDENYFLGRLDYTHSDKTSLFGRYVNDSASLTEPFSGSSIPLWPSQQKTKNQYLTIEQRRIVSSSLINSVRLGFTRTREEAQNTTADSNLVFFPNRDAGQINAGSGISAIGNSTLLPFDLVQRRLSIADDLYWNRGNHSVKMGVAFEKQDTDALAPFQWGGVWTFPNLSAFLQNQPTILVGALPGQDDGFRAIHEYNVTTYFHDDWRIHPTLTLNLGLRWNPRSNPEIIGGSALIDPPNSTTFTPVDRAFATNPGLKTVDPRLGFAWDPFEDHKTSIRGGYAIFHNPVTPRLLGPGYFLNPPFTIGRQDFPTFPTPFVGVQPSLATQSQGLDYNADTTPYQVQWNVNVQREIFEATSVTVGYVGSRGKDQYKQRDLNPVTPTTLADGTLIYGVPRSATAAGIVSNPRVNTALGPLNSGNPYSESDYESLQVSVNRRFHRGFNAQLSYTLSRCRDRSSGAFGGEQGTARTNPYDEDYDYGPCYFDRRHNLRTSAVFALPFSGNWLIEGWSVNTIIAAVSGAPFTPQIGFDQSGLTTGAQRPNLAPGRSLDEAILGSPTQWYDPTVFALPAAGTLGTVGRNSLRGPGLVTVDLGFIKDTRLPGVSDAFAVQFRVEVFNLLNRANFFLPNVNTFVQAPNGGGNYSPTAGRITTAGTARQMQFAVKLLF